MESRKITNMVGKEWNVSCIFKIIRFTFQILNPLKIVPVYFLYKYLIEKKKDEKKKKKSKLLCFAINISPKMLFNEFNLLNSVRHDRFDVFTFLWLYH